MGNIRTDVNTGVAAANQRLQASTSTRLPTPAEQNRARQQRARSERANGPALQAEAQGARDNEARFSRAQAQAADSAQRANARRAETERAGRAADGQAISERLADSEREAIRRPTRAQRADDSQLGTRVDVSA